MLYGADTPIRPIFFPSTKPRFVQRLISDPRLYSFDWARCAIFRMPSEDNIVSVQFFGHSIEEILKLPPARPGTHRAKVKIPVFTDLYRIG